MAARKKKTAPDGGKQDEIEATPEVGYVDLADNPKSKPGRLVEIAEPRYVDLADNPKAQSLTTIDEVAQPEVVEEEVPVEGAAVLEEEVPEEAESE